MNKFSARQMVAFNTGIEAARKMALTAAVTIEARDDACEVRQQAAAAALQGFAEGLRDAFSGQERPSPPVTDL